MYVTCCVDYGRSTVMPVEILVVILIVCYINFIALVYRLLLN